MAKSFTIDINRKIDYSGCREGLHPLKVIHVQNKGYDTELVVRWCPKCGAVVVDMDYDNRTKPGYYKKIQYPEITLTDTIFNISNQTIFNTSDETIYPRYGTKNIFNGPKSSTSKDITIPSVENYKFAGWWELDGSETGNWGKQYLNENGVLINNFNLVGRDTWYARYLFNPDNQKIIYDENGGVEIDDQVYYSNIVDQTITLKTTTKTGYTFKGWYLGNTKYNFSKKVTKNITLVSKTY